MQMLIVMCCRFGSRPLAFATPWVLDPHHDAPQISCCFPVLCTSLNYGSQGPVSTHTPACYRWGRCWGGQTQSMWIWVVLRQWSEHMVRGESSSPVGRDSSSIVVAGGWGAVPPRILMVSASFNKSMTDFPHPCYWDQLCDQGDSSSDEAAGKRQDQPALSCPGNQG